MPDCRSGRIWELDALRGLLILCVAVVHALFDLRYFLLPSYGSWPVFDAVQEYGGGLFVVLSGICATLGSHSLRRGALVFACGLGISAVTAAMVLLGLAGSDVLILFGVLHLLGVCMMLWHFLKKLPTPAMAAVGAALVIGGFLLRGVRVSCPWLFPLGLIPEGFQAGDYFPLLPHLGWFLLGAVLGRTVYREKRTRFPDFPANRAPVRFFRFCGRHSLLIYLGHQPILYGLVLLLGPLLSPA